MATVDVLPRLVRKVPWHTGRHVRGTSGCLPKAPGPLGLNPRAVHTNERLRYFGWRLDCLFTRLAHASSEPEGCTNPENADSLGSGHTQPSWTQTMGVLVFPRSGLMPHKTPFSTARFPERSRGLVPPHPSSRRRV